MKKFSKLGAVLALTMFALFSSITAASAHDELISSSPKAGETLNAAPEKLTLEFSGKLQSLSGVDSTVIALTRDGEKVPASAQTNGTKVIVTPETELANGEYSLAYRVVSSDGHPIENKYSFTVAAPSVVSAVPAAPESAPAEPTPVQDLGSSMNPIVWVIVGVVILGGALSVLIKFTRNTK